MSEGLDLGTLSKAQLAALVQVRGEAIMKFAEAVLAIKEQVEAGEIDAEPVRGLVEWAFEMGSTMATIEEKIIAGSPAASVN